MCVIAGNTWEVLGLQPAYHWAGEYLLIEYYCTPIGSFSEAPALILMLIELNLCKIDSYELKQILRATGKCFHPDCFKCEVCNKKLDGVQFTVDNFNKIHCIEDYYRYL